MSEAEHSETLVLGSGEGGNIWLGTGQVGASHRRNRAQIDWRFLPEHQLPSQQE
jgi:hypothetical protein